MSYGAGHRAKHSARGMSHGCPHHTPVHPQSLPQVSTTEQHWVWGTMSPVMAMPQMTHASKRVGITLTTQHACSVSTTS